jgi:hypothetical protein
MPLPLILAWVAAAIASGGTATAVAKKRAKSRSAELEARIKVVKKRRRKLERKIRAALEQSRQDQRAACAPVFAALELRLEGFRGHARVDALKPDTVVAAALKTVPEVTFRIPEIGGFDPDLESNPGPGSMVLSPLGGPVWLVFTAGGIAVEYVHSAFTDWKKVAESEAEVETIEGQTDVLEEKLPQLIRHPIAKYEAVVAQGVALAEEWGERFDALGLHMASVDQLDAEAEKIVATLALIHRFIGEAVEVDMKDW